MTRKRRRRKRKKTTRNCLIALVAEMETVCPLRVFPLDCGAEKMHLGFEKQTKELMMKKMNKLRRRKKKLLMMLMNMV